MFSLLLFADLTKKTVLDLCADSHTVFDWEKFKKDTGIDLCPDFTDDLTSRETLLKLLRSVDIDERIKYSPDKKDVLIKCAVRGDPYMLLDEKSKEECDNIYKIVVYVTNQLTCIRFRRENFDVEIPSSAIAFDPTYPGLLSSITLNSTVFQNVTEFRAFFTPEGGKPLEELMIPKVFTRGYDHGNNQYNQFGIRVRMVSYI